ncbi:TRAP transporter substrate-binding protein DctP [Bacillus sp. V3B]|uniref:TRAP transporter substrate-binding protein DctP n=1 Tax=Bacillus sp. V3B TaxID=2804915 RepID=UPI00210AEF84|nr:TRAP transporter substrate-binding protein DctP [Bacillus sp. V3B]MCQ6275356.1 TRAP transporter substrate-binding protein DctP [Bacillus sp. V3B]
MRKRKLLLAVLMILGVFLAACGSKEATAGDGSSKNDEQIVIQNANHLPTGHYLHEVNEIFMDRAVELSGGKIKFEYYPAGQLGSFTEMSGLVKDGAVDMGYIFPPGASFLPLSSVVTLPSLATDAVTSGKVFDQLLDDALKEELEKNNLVKIYSFMNPANDIISANKKIEKMDDLKGMKMYSSGGILNVIPDLFNASAVTVQVPDIYQSTTTKVIDGSFFPMSSAAAYHFEEIHNYILTGSNFGGTNNFYAINKQKWDSYPNDVQDALLQAGKEATILNNETMDKEKEKGLKYFEESGVEITKTTPKQHEEIVNKMEVLDELWIKDMEKKGVTKEKAKEVLTEYRKLTNEAVAEKK